MTSDDRQRVRQAVDAHARQQRQALIAAHKLDVCAGCGCELDTYITGCSTCWDRKRHRQRRDDPVYRERCNSNDRARRRRQRQVA